MSLLSFNQLCPDIAEHETRSVTILDSSSSGGVPEGHYAYLEFYCEDTTCDCHTVRLLVVNEKGKEQASISYGWRSKKFYEEHFGAMGAEDFPGPSLALLMPQGPYAEWFLDNLTWMLSSDKPFAERFERHYMEFKKRLLERASQPREGRRNNPCSCGSGRKYKHCCLN